MKLYQNKGWLYQKYIIEKLAGRKIAKLINCNYKTIYFWLKKFNIPILPPRKHSKETKRKISESRIGEKNPAYGKPAWNRGIPSSKKTKEKISKSLIYSCNNVIFIFTK